MENSFSVLSEALQISFHVAHQSWDSLIFDFANIQIRSQLEHTHSKNQLSLIYDRLSVQQPALQDPTKMTKLKQIEVSKNNIIRQIQLLNKDISQVEVIQKYSKQIPAESTITHKQKAQLQPDKHNVSLSHGASITNIKEERLEKQIKFISKRLNGVKPPNGNHQREKNMFKANKSKKKNVWLLKLEQEEAQKKQMQLQAAQSRRFQLLKRLKYGRHIRTQMSKSLKNKQKPILSLPKFELKDQLRQEVQELSNNRVKKNQDNKYLGYPKVQKKEVQSQKHQRLKLSTKPFTKSMKPIQEQSQISRQTNDRVKQYISQVQRNLHLN